MKKEGIIKKYYWVAILAAIIAFIIGGVIYRTAIHNFYKENFVKYDFEELTGRPYKVPLFDKYEVTLTGWLITFVDGGKEFKLIQFEKLVKWKDIMVLPMKLIRNDGKEVFLLTNYIKEGNLYNQKQSALIGAVVKNPELSIEDSILRVKFDTIDKYGNPSFEEKFFNTKSWKFQPYYPYIDNGAIGLEIIQSPWIWKKTTYGTWSEVIPKKEDFSIVFDENGLFNATTDCNKLNGMFIMSESGSVTFWKIASTKKWCPESQEKEFTNMLLEAETFVQTGSTLTFWLKTNSGSMVFEKSTK